MPFVAFLVLGALNADIANHIIDIIASLHQ